MFSPLRLPQAHCLAGLNEARGDGVAVRRLKAPQIGLVRLRARHAQCSHWPAKVGEIKRIGDITLWCTRPLTWIALGNAVDAFLQGTRDALKAVTHQCFDITDAYLSVVIEGPKAPEFLAAGLSIASDPISDTAGVRTLFGQLPVLLRGQEEGYLLMVDISYADHFWHFAKAVLGE